MRKGEIQVDWIIAFLIFIIFVAWSFQYYTAFRIRTGPIEQAAESVESIIIGNITNSVYEMPVSYTSPRSWSGAVMYAVVYWNSADEKNTIKVFNSASSKLDCMISGNKVYWTSDVVSGQNNFTIRISNRTESALNCTATIATLNANLTIPKSGDMRVMVSQSAIDRLNSAGYGAFKEQNGIRRDFRLQLDMVGGSYYFGGIPPNSSSVTSLEKWYYVEETNNKTTITTMVW